MLILIDRYGADDSSRKSALSALYLAAGRLVSEPIMTTSPSEVDTDHLHFRPRFVRAISKTGNRSRHRDGALRTAFKTIPQRNEEKSLPQLVDSNAE